MKLFSKASFKEYLEHYRFGVVDLELGRLSEDQVNDTNYVNEFIAGNREQAVHPEIKFPESYTHRALTKSIRMGFQVSNKAIPLEPNKEYAFLAIEFHYEGEKLHLLEYSDGSITAGDVPVDCIIEANPHAPGERIILTYHTDTLDGLEIPTDVAERIRQTRMKHEQYLKGKVSSFNKMIQAHNSSIQIKMQDAIGKLRESFKVRRDNLDKF